MNKLVVPKFDKNIYHTLDSIVSCDFTLWELFYHYTILILNRHNGNRTHAAIDLGISVKTLRKRLSEMKNFGYIIKAGITGNPTRRKKEGEK